MRTKPPQCLGKVILAAIVGMSTSGARGGLAFDLRATAVNGAPLSGIQTPHDIPFATVGDVIQFDVFVVVTGTDADFTNDKFASAIGSFKSTPPDPSANLRGDLLLDVVRTAIDPDTGEPIPPFGFDAPGFSVGLQQDLDGDGDIDVGSNDPSNAANHWAVRYFLEPTFDAPAGLPDGRKVGFGTFQVTSAALGSATLLRFAGRNVRTGSLYIEDGRVLSRPSLDSTMEHSILVSAVPEPVPIGTSCIAFLTLTRRRR